MDHHGRVSQSRLGQVAVQDIVAVVSGVDAATGCIYPREVIADPLIKLLPGLCRSTEDRRCTEAWCW